MFRGLSWLFAAVFPPVLGFWSAAAMGLGALGSWLGGRSQSKQHQRQVSSEDRRHAASLADRDAERKERARLMEQYWAQEQARRREWAAGRGQVLGALLPSLGVNAPPEALAALAAGGGGGGAPMAPPAAAGMGGYQALPVTTSGVRGGAPGGNWDWISQIKDILADDSKAPWQRAANVAGEIPQSQLHVGQAQWLQR